MTNLQDIIKLCQEEQGKVFVTDDKGNITLVILGIDQYQSIKNGKGSVTISDVEAINKQIIQAQLEEGNDAKKSPVNVPRVTSAPAKPKVDLREEVIDPSFDFDSTDDL